VPANNIRLFDCFHAYFWLMPLTLDLDGNVGWICAFCGNTIKREIGTVPVWGSE
jgi:hypothetical protein